LIELQIIGKNRAYSCKIIKRLFILTVAMFLIETSIVEAGRPVHLTDHIDKSSYCIVELSYGSINWTTGVIRAKGRSSSENSGNRGTDDSSVLKSAKNSARDHLVEILNVIGLPGKYRISEAAPLESQSPTISAEVTQSIHMIIAQMKKKAMSAKVVEVRHISKKIAEVTLETDMYGDFLQSVLPPAIREIPDIELFESGNHYQESDLGQRTFHADQGFRSSDSISSKDSHTGIIIDARDIGFKPVICPVIVSEQGEEIYSPPFISRKYAVERGVCSYFSTHDLSLLSQKVGNNPVTIKGLRRDSDRNYSIIISMSDADKIQRMPERHLFMKGCKVAIIVSP